MFNFSHGTKVTGLVAAEANNNRCIVGVAHKSTIFGKENAPVEYKDPFDPQYLSYRTKTVYIKLFSLIFFFF